MVASRRRTLGRKARVVLSGGGFVLLLWTMALFLYLRAIDNHDGRLQSIALMMLLAALAGIGIIVSIR
jgi:hypothetical protein